MKAAGWIYDAYPQDDQIILWMKTDDGRVLKLTDSYLAEFYALPKEQHSVGQLAEAISGHPLVETVSVCTRYVRINDQERSEVVQVAVRPAELRRVVCDLEAAGFCTLYNIDLNPAQRYFLSKELYSIGKFTISLDEDQRLREIALEDQLGTPPIQVEQIAWDSKESVIKEQVENSRSQIITVPRTHLAAFYAFLRKSSLLNGFGWRPLPGKLIIDSETFQTFGLAGLDEKSEFAALPIGVVSRWGPARVIDSRQCYEAIKKGILIPRTRTGTARNVLTAKEVAYTDRGALILSPRVGLHEKVAELDFKSLFPSIIVKHNISYETVSANGIHSKKKGLLPEFTEQFIGRRLNLKQIKKQLPEQSEAWNEYDQREQTLKKLLVSIFGYSGSDLNRFGNVFAYREVNRLGRETVVAAMNTALREGFEVIYLDTDSVFVERPTADLADFLALSQKIEKRTGFEISLANHYRYLVLLPQEADPEIEAARRFYGKLTDGKVYYRGIELRRHDYPIFMKRFQQRLLDIILEADSARDIVRKQLRIAVEYSKETLERILSGDVPIAELGISKILRMPVERYRSLFPHVIAAVQLQQKQKPVKPGDYVDYVYVDSKEVNPMKRVAPLEFTDTYDADRYAEMLLDVAESVLGVFGFSGTQLGFQRRPKNFLEALRVERGREILLELESLEDGLRNHSP
jgi:DNA polymerase elongation subunit (family B)